MNRYSRSVGKSRHYDLLITSQCDAKGRVMGITWRMTALVSSGFFVLTRFGLLELLPALLFYNSIDLPICPYLNTFRDDFNSIH